MKVVTQMHTSRALPHFEKNFQEKWGLRKYDNPNEPAVFFGMYDQNDVNLFVNHNSTRIMVFGGNDMHPPQLQIVKHFVDSGHCFISNPEGEFSDTLTEFGIPHKQFYLAVKDYSLLQPTSKGENIYVYVGQPDNIRVDYFKYREVIQPLIDTFGSDRVIRVTESNALSESELKSKYYDDCFCYIKPNPRGGNTSMWDLGHMGIKTFGKGLPHLPNFEEFTSHEHLVNMIVKEADTMGTTDYDIAKQTAELFIDSRWLDLDWWKTDEYDKVYVWS